MTVQIALCRNEQIEAFFDYFVQHELEFKNIPLLVLFEASENYIWPFQARPSQILIPDFPSYITACIPYFEDKNIASRIACLDQERPGCYFGSVGELVDILALTHRHHPHPSPYGRPLPPAVRGDQFASEQETKTSYQLIIL